MKSQISNLKSQIKRGELEDLRYERQRRRAYGNTNFIRAGSKKIFLATSALLLLTLGFTQNAYAQVQTITISPPTADFSLNPGAYAEGTIKIINDDSEAISFEASFQDFIVDNPLGIPSFQINNTSERYSASSWLEVSPSSFVIPPQTHQTVNYYIHVPSTARPGGHYAGLIFSPQNSSSLSNSGASVNTNIAALLSVSVNGETTEKANVISITGDKFSEFGPVRITTTIQNLGDLHIKPQGRVSLINMLGSSIEAKNLPENNIFPEASRNFEVSLGNKFMLGRYKASFLGSYGKNNNNPLTSEFYFWVFPWRAFILAVLMLLAAILSAIYLKRRREPKKPDLPKAPIQ